MTGTCERPNHLPCRTSRTVAAFKKLLREAARSDAPPRYACDETAQVPDFLRFTPLPVGTLWRAKSRSMNGQRGPDTHCGNVNPHRHMQVGAMFPGIGKRLLGIGRFARGSKELLRLGSGSRLPAPDSRFPIPDSRFPVPGCYDSSPTSIYRYDGSGSIPPERS